MRHRKRGRHLGRTSSHRRALLRNLASSLFLTERDAEFDDNRPKVKGRVVTTLQKAKEVRPLVEKCITIARRTLEQRDAAEKLGTSAERNSSEWKAWRESKQWVEWANARAPVVAARRRVFQLLRDKEATRICFDEIAPRFADRPGGYTRILKLAKPRLGDAGAQAILEFVGQHDRLRNETERPTFADDEPASNRPAQEPQASAPGNEPEATSAASSDTESGETEKGGNE